MSEFTVQRYIQLAKIERAHFWFIARRKLIIGLLKKYQSYPVKSMADIGCGTGYNLTYWTGFANQLIGIDRLIDRTPHARLKQDFPLISGDVTALPLTDRSQQTLISLDVLEHVDDRDIMQELARVIEPRGLLFITVPAYQWLWSHRDEAAGHQRRYSRKQLKLLIEENGFSVKYISYYQCFLMPLVLLSRFIMPTRKLHQNEEKPLSWLNRMLTGIALIEVKLTLMGMRMPWGSSLVLVAQKV